jgi:molecular chaperone DnaJ
MAESLYDILGVPKTATKEEIKKAYKKKALEHHPDKGGDEEVFKKVSSAYSVLSDDEKKKNYDTFGDATGRKQQSSPFDRGPFRNPFGGFRMKSRSINLNVELTVEEVFTGTVKSVSFFVERLCGVCKGTGATEVKVCESCNGQGAHVHQMGSMQQITMCGTCNGTGKVPIKICGTCGGKGRTSVKESYDIQIPKGVSEDNKMVLEGVGNDSGGAERGDAILNIKIIPHPLYHFEGLDLHKKEELPIIDMILGSEHEIESLGGRFKISIPEGCESNKVIRLRGQGVKNDNLGVIGDLYVKLVPKIPKNLTPEEKEKLLEFKRGNINFS